VNWQWRIIGVSLIGALYIAVIGWNSKPSEHLAPPSLQHLLGTDQLGRDMFTRMIIGSGVTLGLTVVVVVLSVSIGLIFGMMAGLMGRWLDKLC
ncbi:ABC transporter permease, partial [Staphylococcus epidermidis]